MIWEPKQVHAAGDTYTLLEPIPGSPSSVNTGADQKTYLTTVYNTALTLTIALSVIMLVIGRIQYTLSYIPSSKAEGQQKIWAAIGGLLLALFSVLILKTINPKLLEVVLPT